MNKAAFLRNFACVLLLAMTLAFTTAVAHAENGDDMPVALLALLSAIGAAAILLALRLARRIAWKSAETY